MGNFHSTKYASEIGGVGDKIPVTDKVGNVNDAYTFFENVVPGDVIYYPGQHIMIVQDIADTSLTDSTTNKKFWMDGSSIDIIESVFNDGLTSGTKALYGVGKNRTAEMLTILDKDWSVWRQK